MVTVYFDSGEFSVSRSHIYLDFPFIGSLHIDVRPTRRHPTKKLWSLREFDDKGQTIERVWGVLGVEISHSPSL
ncbi:MAG: hypothetical protein AB7D07_01950 [Desulfovibrionaceae bacterium]